MIDSLQLTAKHKVATPADWKDGEDCIVVPAVSDDDAAKLFPKGVRKVKPYLRYTPQPNAKRGKRTGSLAKHGRACGLLRCRFR